jgi:putative transposase
MTSRSSSRSALVSALPGACACESKPDQNAFIERFNRTYREEVLDAYVFESLADVQRLTDEWLTDCNEQRPHDALGRVPPTRFFPRPLPTPAESTNAVCP